MSIISLNQQLTIADLQQMKAQQNKITALTAYDASFAAQFDQAGVELLLVGDSLGNVIQGQKSTLPVSIADMIYHTQCVVRAASRAYIVVDMPFLSYNHSHKAIDNAALLMQQGGANMVKLECDRQHLSIVEQMVNEGIPVSVHLGLRPQQIEKMGKYKVQGKTAAAAEQIQQLAKQFIDVGADLLLLESVSAPVASTITAQSSIPVIGIGAGKDCDGQILVCYDMLGITMGHTPKFASNFLADPTCQSVADAVKAYVAAVKANQFPADEHCFN